MLKRSFIVVLVLSLAAVALAQSAELQRFERTQRHMGSDFSVKLYATSMAQAERGFTAAFGLIAQYDKSMSDYNAESELMRLCAKSPTPELNEVSEPLFAVLLRARELNQETGGAFDVTVGPLTRLWRRARRQRELPTEEERSTALAAVGQKHIELDAKKQRVKLNAAGMRIDLGGIAPGFAADRALAELRELGITSALVDASGDVVIGDPPPGEKGWKVGIAPLQADQPPDRFLLVSHAAISTSGDAFRGVEIEGVRYSHIVDPVTGIGLKHRSSVTVIAPDGATADGLATAVSVLGVERGRALIEKLPQTHVRIVYQDERGKTHSSESPGFRRFDLPPSRR